MTEESPSERVQQDSVKLSATSNQSARAEKISGSRGEQSLTGKKGEHEHRTQAAAQRHELALRKLDHQQSEEIKENDRRRLLQSVGFLVVTAIVVGGTVVGSIAAVTSPEQDVRFWGQNISTTLLGGVVGALAGYFTGRSGK